MRLMMIWAMLSGAALAEGEKAGDFDYYVMALSWSPNWCALEGDRRGSDQCDARHDYGWILHGLWPQNERGYPSNCRVGKRDPSRSDTKAMSDIMATGGLAWHQWKKHGRCSGLSSDAYFTLSREAYGSIERPAVLRKLEKTVRLPATLIEEAFLEVNPALEPDMITITCKGKYVQEARVCLTKDLQPRKCGRDVIRDCTARALFDPVR